MVSIAGIAAAYPPPVTQQDLWDGFFARHYGGVQKNLAKRIFANSGVTTRHAAVNPLLEDASGWSTAVRMERYLTEALPLGKDAIAAALADAGVAAGDVGLLAVASCTGYATPGPDILLARDLGLAPDAQRLFIGHMGCYAALPGLRTVADYVARAERPAVLLCVELTSLHLQPSTVDPQQVVAHALFSDAAAAVVVVPDSGNQAGYRVGEFASVTDTSAADYMTWHVTDLGFRMGLSPRVPEVVGRYLRPLVTGLLARNGLELSDVEAWAVHPGGPRILDVARDELGRTEAALGISRAMLADHGNCSSPTVLMILDQLRRTGTGGPVVTLAFGPGLTLYAGLLNAP